MEGTNQKTNVHQINRRENMTDELWDWKGWHVIKWIFGTLILAFVLSVIVKTSLLTPEQSANVDKVLLQMIGRK